MSAFRTVISALCILLGALGIVAWGVSTVAVRAVDDGTALTGIAETALGVPGVTGALSGQVQEQVLTHMDERGFDAEAWGIAPRVRDLVDTAVRSEAFEQALLAQVAAAQDDFLYQLTHPETETGPLVLAVDASSLLNARIDDIGGDAAQAVPDVAVAPIEVEVISADGMANAQTGYGWMGWWATWGLWASLAVLALGIVVSHRRRWFVAKALIAVGVIGLAFGLTVRFVDPLSIAAFLPGREDGLLGTAWLTWVTEETAPGLASRAMLAGGIALAVGLVVAIVGRAASSRR